MNQVSIIGRLGQDPELRYTPSGKAVSRMSVAVNERYGENERVYWFPVICWNGLGETVSQYLHKGSKVAVSGRLTTRSYETEDGNRTITEIIANSVDFLDPRPSDNGPREEAPIPDDEIPF
ncbi:MAG: single-stranded DNA-binding protein [Deltaproteobacteria bacterium]|nr:single-stranded DNA-binding protein [Deltaproteobacteria bacterium]MBW2026579.1 single-stranded DNA-binding protein [Deltaproteobacteria bacterium]